jgi:acyl-CoA synthetase (AMP-forming)/AMP-acid ligase II
VRDAAVVSRASADGRPALTGYIADPDGLADLGRLRQHLVTRLPEYLIPRQVVALDRLPLTGDGEHDTAVLAAMQTPPEDEQDPARGSRREQFR